MHDYMKPPYRKLPEYIILQIGINNTFDNTSREMLGKVLKLKAYRQKE